MTLSKYMIIKLFLTFFYINILTPSGPASYGLTEKIFVPGNLDKETFARITAVSSSIPGSDAIQIAWQIGFELGKLPGALAALVGALLPCVTLVILATSLIRIFPKEQTAKFFNYVKPALIILLLSYAFQLITPVRSNLNWKYITIFILSGFMFIKNVNPFFIMLLSGFIGILL